MVESLQSISNILILAAQMAKEAEEKNKKLKEAKGG